MISMEAVSVDDVVVPDGRMRALKDFGPLADSIQEIGLLNPITITEGCVLISGLHRLAACRALKWERIPAIVTDANAAMAEIDENLCRIELTALERAQHLARRKEVWEALYPGTKHGANQHTTREDGAERFTSDSARKTGRSEKTIRRAVKLAHDLDDDAAELLAGTPTADNQQELARLAKLEPEEQRAVAAMLASGEATRVKVAARRVRAAQPMPDLDGDVPASVQIRCCTVVALLAELTEAETTVGFVTADPPWPYKNQRINGSTDGHYESYGLDEIARDVDAAYDVAADDCYLALWVTGPFVIPWALAAARFTRAPVETTQGGDDGAWVSDTDQVKGDWEGFRWEFISAGVWNKRPDNTGRIGAGTHWRGDGEILLLYRKGKPQPLATISNAHASERTAHSEKPGPFCFDLVKAFCPRGAPVLDLFCGRAPTARACLGLLHPYWGCDTDESRVHEALEAIEEQRRPGRESRERARAAGVRVTS